MKLKLPSLAALRPFATAVALQSLVVLAALLVLLVPLVALAQVAGPAAPTVGDILKQVLDLVATWKTGGSLVGIVTLTNLLTNATKLPSLDPWLGKWWWLRPTIALACGIVSGTVSAVIGGVPWLTAIVVGLGSGLTSIAAHELFTQFNARVRTERGVGGAVVAVAASGDAAKVEAMKIAFDGALKITDEKARLAALAKWANENG